MAHDQGYDLSDSIVRFHRDIDPLFEHASDGLDLWPAAFTRQLLMRMNEGMVKPTQNLGATGNDYTITVEIPTVDEKDVSETDRSQAHLIIIF